MASFWLYCGCTFRPDVCRSSAATPFLTSESRTLAAARFAASSAALTDEAVAEMSSESCSSSGVPAAVPVPVTVIDGADPSAADPACADPACADPACDC